MHLPIIKVIIYLEGSEKLDFLNHHQIGDGLKHAVKLYLWTEKGALLHAKSLNTDVAWEVYSFKKIQKLIYE